MRYLESEGMDLKLVMVCSRCLAVATEASSCLPIFILPPAQQSFCHQIKRL
jgi:hypothetical protein